MSNPTILTSERVTGESEQQKDDVELARVWADETYQLGYKVEELVSYMAKWVWQKNYADLSKGDLLPTNETKETWIVRAADMDDRKLGIDFWFYDKRANSENFGYWIPLDATTNPHKNNEQDNEFRRRRGILTWYISENDARALVSTGTNSEEKGRANSHILEDLLGVTFRTRIDKTVLKNLQLKSVSFKGYEERKKAEKQP